MYKKVTFAETFKCPKFLAIPLAALCGLLIPPFMRSARAIPVYRNTRGILKTMMQSVELLQNNHQVIIFPDVKYDSSAPEVEEIYTGFLYLEKMYYKIEQKHVEFIPLSFERDTKTISRSDSIFFKGDMDYKSEKIVMSKKIIEAINGYSAQTTK